MSKERKKLKSFVKRNSMSSTTSTVMPLIIQTPRYQTDRDQIMMMNRNGTIINEPLVGYQTSKTIRRSYFKPSKSKYHYMIEQVNLTKISS